MRKKAQVSEYVSPQQWQVLVNQPQVLGLYCPLMWGVEIVRPDSPVLLSGGFLD